MRVYAFFLLLSLAASLRWSPKLRMAIEKSGERGKFGYSSTSSKSEAYGASKEADPALPCIILVNPYLDQNVGSVARAMLNFGLTDLRVVNPQPNCDILSEQARALAVGSVDVLENARIFPSLTNAIADLNRVMATTIRPRAMTQVIYTPEKAADIAVQSREDLKKDGAVKCGIVFGRERSGLTNEEVALADSIVTIATNKYFSSINLAQAVNIVCHELWKVNIAKNPHNPGVIGVDSSGQRPDTWLHPKDGERLARREELDMFLKRVEDALSNTNYQRDESRREICLRNIRNVFQRTLMTKTEVDLMHGMLTGLLSPKGANDKLYVQNPQSEKEEELMAPLEGRLDSNDYKIE